MKEELLAEENLKIPDHIDKAGLEQKILDLFEYRMFPVLLDHMNKPRKEKTDFFRHLFNLQEAIYVLDAHLECNWQVDDAMREKSWNNIVFYLKKCLHSGQLPGPYLLHIEKYEKHELALRSALFPDRFTMSYFYYYKSCDVKLLRRLIYEFGRLEGKDSRLSDWRWFDYVTEINDDISDVEEDMGFYNGNRFLIELLRHGKKYTETGFKKMLDSIRLNTEKRMTGQRVTPFQQEIHHQTLENVRQTTEMLKSVIEQIHPDELKNKWVMAKYIR